MVARLASLPLRLRAKDVMAVVVMGLAVGGVLVAMWAGTPSAEKPVHFEATVLSIDQTLTTSKTQPPQAVIQVELHDHRRDAVQANYSVVTNCKPGDPIHLVRMRSLAGITLVEVEAPACG